ncbi:unnamed protein product [Lepidochelys kempii]
MARTAEGELLADYCKEIQHAGGLDNTVDQSSMHYSFIFKNLSLDLGQIFPSDTQMQFPVLARRIHAHISEAGLWLCIVVNLISCHSDPHQPPSRCTALPLGRQEE